jgi:hypothetical protein
VPDPVTILIAVGIAFWLGTVAVVFAVCRMASHSDAELSESASHIPRRASTWGTVRMRILKSPQSDQFATYR